jgi:hypothetical protein
MSKPVSAARWVTVMYCFLAAGDAHEPPYSTARHAPAEADERHAQPMCSGIALAIAAAQCHLARMRKEMTTDG